MPSIRVRCVFLVFCGLVFASPLIRGGETVLADPASSLRLWYDKPAEHWVEALPLGNGRLGAMVFGATAHERLQLNEDTVWAGGPHNNDNPAAHDAIPEVRRLIFAGKYTEAHRLATEKILPGVGKPNGMPYQPVGDLLIDFPGHDKFENYRRELSLDDAVARVAYDVAGVHYTRELFSSLTDQVIALRFTANAQGKLNFTLSWRSPQRHTVAVEPDSALVLAGITGDHESIRGSVKFDSRVQVAQHDGKLSTTDHTITVSDATTAVVLVAIGTNYINFRDLSADPTARSRGALTAAAGKPFEALRQAHVAAYQKQFQRVRLDLGTTAAAARPTDERLRHFAEGKDPQLAALYFQFGRYLLIASSQPGTQPATLQGIWNDQMLPPWDSKYTVNINTEMNYWPAETTNLAELHEPLIQMLREVSISGADTAKDLYGAGGWVLHHNTDAWRIAGPVDNAGAGIWPMAGAWFSQHLWYHYLFGGDRAYLASVYPIMKGAAQFFLDTLGEEPSHHWLVVCPSVSPENTHRRTPDPKVRLAAGVTMDVELLFELFTDTVRAAEILGVDDEFRAKLNATRDRLPPLQIGRFGQLQEWLEDWDDPEDHHRHISHLYALAPSNLISPRRTPALFAAARTSLEHRGDVSTGWSMGWKVNCWARLLDGDRAYRLLTDQLRPTGDTREHVNGGGTYPNLFDAHPPFQIDGNFGCAAGIAEMFVQSHDGDIHLLPALPHAWSEGRVSGLRARGGFEVNVVWRDAALSEVSVVSPLGGNARIRSHCALVRKDGQPLETAKGENPNPFFFTPDLADAPGDAKPIGADDFVYDVPTKPGEILELVRK